MCFLNDCVRGALFWPAGDTLSLCATFHWRWLTLPHPHPSQQREQDQLPTACRLPSDSIFHSTVCYIRSSLSLKKWVTENFEGKLMTCWHVFWMQCVRLFVSHVCVCFYCCYWPATGRIDGLMMVSIFLTLCPPPLTWTQAICKSLVCGHTLLSSLSSPLQSPPFVPPHHFP